MNKILRALFLFLLFPLVLNSLSEVESYKVELNTASDKEKIQIYLEMVELTESLEPDSAKMYTNNAIGLSAKIAI